MTHTTGEPLDVGGSATATAARQAAVRAAQRYMAHGGRGMPRLFAPVSLSAPSVPPLVELRSAVEAYVAALKAAGRPPESTVVLVKQVIAEVDAPPDDADLLRREAVRWTIDAYYST